VQSWSSATNRRAAVEVFRPAYTRRTATRSRSYFTTDGQSVSQSVCLGVGHHQIFLLPFFCQKIALLLWWEDGPLICVKSVSGQSRGGLTFIHYCIIWDYWVPFPSPLTTRRDYGGSIITCFHAGRDCNWGLRSRYDWWSVSQHVLASSPPWDLRPDINSVWILLSCLCWREVGSVSC
jgi:hypothetical protein